MQVTIGYIKNPMISRLAPTRDSQPTVEAPSLGQSDPQDSYKPSMSFEPGMIDFRRHALASGFGTAAGGAPGQRGAHGQTQGGGGSPVKPAMSTQIDELNRCALTSP